MRALLPAILVLLPMTASAAAPDVMYAERSALLGADRTCGLFDPPLRAALEAATVQARGALLRSGWTEDRADRLGRAATAEGGAKRCSDPAIAAAARNARAGFAGWARLMSMRFTGGASGWNASRIHDHDDFYLRQDVTSPRAMTFGIRQEGPRAAVGLMLPLGATEAAPAAARLYFRDRARAPRSAADLPGRVSTGLAALAASRASSETLWASSRRTVQVKERRAAVFLFPDAAMAKIGALDPREALVLEVDTAAGLQRFYVEVGDFAAGQAFLQAQAGS